MVGALPGRAAELGGEHDVVAAPVQGPADDVLGIAVGVGGVDDVEHILAGIDELPRVCHGLWVHRIRSHHIIVPARGSRG